MSPAPHLPVLADQVVEQLAPAPGQVVFDGTLGAGGHAERVLDAGARLIGVDRDPTALAIARERLARFAERVTIVHATFAEAQSWLDKHVGPDDAVLLENDLPDIYERPLRL